MIFPTEGGGHAPETDMIDVRHFLIVGHRQTANKAVKRLEKGKLPQDTGGGRPLGYRSADNHRSLVTSRTSQDSLWVCGRRDLVTGRTIIEKG